MTLDELRQAWETRDPVQRRAACKRYVAESGTLLAPFQKLTREELVSECSKARARGDATGALELEAWLMSEYEPQHITGRVRPGGA